jgi:Dolichyl-phosphate-mannose-protein mannosyltransferase
MGYKPNDRHVLSPKTVACFILCSLGVFLRVWQYCANRSLWVDEAMLASNIVNRSFGGLMQPLNHGQGAPIAFLFIEKALIEHLGNKDYVLRLFPLLASIVAIFLMWKVAEDYIGGWGPLFALSFFAICENLIYYASELKQYSSDVMYSLLLLTITPKCLDVHATPQRLMLFGFIGGVSVWFSHPVVFIISSVFLVLALDTLKSKEPRVMRLHRLLWIGGAAALCLASFSLLFVTSLRVLSANTGLLEYWRDAFMPVPPWKDGSWFYNAWYGLLNGLLGLSLVKVGTIVIVLGCMSLFFKRWQFMLVLTMPFVLTLLVSGMRKYPFSGRLMLFSIPILVLLIAEGIERTRLLLVRVSPRTAISATAVLTSFLLYRPVSVAWDNFSRPPMGEHIKPTMSYLDQNRIYSDIIYIYYAAIPAFEYYASAFGFHQGDYIKGISSREQPEKYLNEMDRFRNRERVWFIFSHNCGRCKVDEENFFLQYLETVGSRVAVFKSEGASVYLYNLTGRNPRILADPDKLSATIN